MLWLLLFLSTVSAELYILLEEPRLHKCAGVRNAVTADEKNVNIRDRYGRKVYYVRSPGEYTVNFDDIKVERDLGYLSGDVTAKIQVPLIDAGFGLRFDVPYQAIPETGLLASKCDEQSTVVEYNGKQYCRYCDLCTTAADVEEALKEEKHKYLRGIDGGDVSGDRPISEVCTQIEGGAYEIHRKLKVPSKEELEKIARKSTRGANLSPDLKSRLEKNAGRIQVEVRVMSSPTQASRPLSPTQRGCHPCCDPNGPCPNQFASSLGRWLNCGTAECRQDTTECLPSSAEVVGCTIAEFQYSLTEDKNVVRRFLDDHGIRHDPDLDDTPPEPKPEIFRPRPRPTHRSSSRPAGRPRPSTSARKLTPGQERCLGELSGIQAKICRNFFKDHFCCKHCSGCAPN